MTNYPVIVEGSVEGVCKDMQFTDGEKYILELWFETFDTGKSIHQRVDDLQKSLTRFYVWWEATGFTTGTLWFSPKPQGLAESIRIKLHQLLDK